MPVLLEKSALPRLAPVFSGWSDSMVTGCLCGCIGEAWADEAAHPRSGLLFSADFGFLSGAPDRALAAQRPSDGRRFFILVPQNEQLGALIERAYGSNARRVTRFATQRDPACFDRDALAALAAVPAGYTLRFLDNEQLYRACLAENWSGDFCGNFGSFSDFSAHGLCVIALHNDAPVSGAGSYAWCPGGIEVEIDTKPEHRRRGLAAACAARLILACLDRGIYPSWDAQNTASLALARKLGYRPAAPYPAYEVTLG